DLNLPRRNGLEVLAELKADRDLLTIPVVILTTSQAEADIVASYRLHANAYITKPPSFDLFTEAIRRVDDFFLTLLELPTWAPRARGRRPARGAHPPAPAGAAACIAGPIGGNARGLGCYRARMEAP